MLNSNGIVGLLTIIPKLTVGLILLVHSEGVAAVAGMGLDGVLKALNINPAMLAITALVAAEAVAALF